MKVHFMIVPNSKWHMPGSSKIEWQFNEQGMVIEAHFGHQNRRQSVQRCSVQFTESSLRSSSLAIQPQPKYLFRVSDSYLLMIIHS
jgi:hypothetical protein